MFGFGRKKGIVSAVSIEAALPVQTIPDIFYGGQDPVIYDRAKASDPNNQVTVARLGASAVNSKVSFFSHRWLLIALSGFLFLLIVAGISWYYLRDYWSATTRPALPVSSPVSAEPSTAPTDGELTVATTTPSEIATSTESEPTVANVPFSLLSEPPLVFPPHLELTGSDLDSDGLTDSEEEALGTDSAVWDSDADGYFDGQEVFNLYNPKGQAPVLLIDSGVVSEYVNPVFGYRVYYPQGWQVGVVDNGSRQVLFSAARGDYIELRAGQLLPGEDFVAWFARVAPGEKITDLTEAVNRFSVTVRRRSDDLVAYVVSGRLAYVFIYNPREVGPIVYKNIMNMLTQSFRPGPEASEIEPQPLLPTAPISLPVTTILPVIAVTSSEPDEARATTPTEP